MRTHSGRWITLTVGAAAILAAALQAHTVSRRRKPSRSRRPTTTPRSTIASGCWPSGPQFRVYRLTYPSPVVTPLVQNNTDSRRLLPAQRHPAGRRQASGGHLPAHPRRQRAADRSGLLGAGQAGHSGHFVQAALLRQRGTAQGTRSPGRRSEDVRRRDRPGGRRHPPHDRPAGLAAGDQSRADRHHGHQPGRDHRRHGRRRRAAAPSGGPDPVRRRSAADHPSRPRNPAT